jgi:phosphoesterase RecJ-like protein
LPTFPELLRQKHRYLLTGHENPDGDCLGAQCALFHLLVALGSEVTIVNPDPIGATYDFLSRHTPFGNGRLDQPLPPADVVVLLDCNQMSRVGALGKRLLATGAQIAVVDHHIGSNDVVDAILYVDPTAASTGTLVRRLYRELALPLSPAAAEGVFLSLIADTGWFRYSNTDAEVLGLAAELVAAGVDVAGMYDRIHRRMHPDSAGLLARMLATHELRLRGRLAVACIDKATMEHAARVDFDTDQVLDPLRSLAGVEVVALFKERFGGQVKLSLRAKGDVDVERIARACGGGGHKKAAGATLSLPMAEAVQRIEAMVAEGLAGLGGQARS